MAKKCIPGFICIDSMTLFLGMILVLFLVFLIYRLSNLGNKNPEINAYSNAYSNGINPSLVIHTNTNTNLSSCRNTDPLTDPYVPPEQIPSPSLSPISTQPYVANYTQMGILTRKHSNSSDDILPLMGRRQRNARNKWQYYTMSGGANGNIQTKLPIRVKGKSGTGEYGCDEIYTNDVVFVEGYKDLFIATIYENNMFSYIA